MKKNSDDPREKHLWNWLGCFLRHYHPERSVLSLEECRECKLGDICQRAEEICEELLELRAEIKGKADRWPKDDLTAAIVKRRC